MIRLAYIEWQVGLSVSISMENSVKYLVREMAKSFFQDPTWDILEFAELIRHD